MTLNGRAIVVCALDVACETSIRNSEIWLEGFTREINIIVNSLTLNTANRKCYSIRCKAMKQVAEIEVISDTEITATGLDKGQFLAGYANNGSVDYFHIEQNEIRSVDTSLLQSIAVLYTSYRFEEIKKNRISIIVRIIKTLLGVSLLTKDESHSVAPPQYLSNRSILS